MSLERDLSIDIFNSFEIKLFELKINQKVVNYRERSIFKIFIRYYLYLIRNCFFNKKALTNSKESYRIVISHVDSIKGYEFLNKYSNYIKFNKINLSCINFIREFLTIFIYLYQYFRLNSIYKNQIFEAYLNSKIIINYINTIKAKEVVFFGYDYDLTFFYAIIKLNAKNIETIQYCNSGFLGNHNLIVAKTLYCRTIIHKEYMQKRKDIFHSDNIIALDRYSIVVKPKEKRREKIAIYTSGYYARLRFDFSNKNLIKQGVLSEKGIINVMKQYALENSNIEIVLFIHLHNNIENISDAKEYYNEFLSLPNVRIQEESENSINNFNSYDLGICCMSEIFFDRYERGYKTILINPFTLDDFISSTALNNVTLYDKDENIIDAITLFLDMSNKKYFELLEKKY